MVCDDRSSPWRCCCWEESCWGLQLLLCCLIGTYLNLPRRSPSLPCREARQGVPAAAGGGHAQRRAGRHVEEEEEVNAESSALAASTALYLVKPAHCNGPERLGRREAGRSQRVAAGPSFWPFRWQPRPDDSRLAVMRALQQGGNLCSAKQSMQYDLSWVAAVEPSAGLPAHKLSDQG